MINMKKLSGKTNIVFSVGLQEAESLRTKTKNILVVQKKFPFSAYKIIDARH